LYSAFFCKQRIKKAIVKLKPAVFIITGHNSMKVILTQDITGLGSIGDLVAVKDGFGRNYLLGLVGCCSSSY